jgi:hypothetical protein
MLLPARLPSPRQQRSVSFLFKNHKIKFKFPAIGSWIDGLKKRRKSENYSGLLLFCIRPGGKHQLALDFIIYNFLSMAYFPDGLIQHSGAPGSFCVEWCWPSYWIITPNPPPPSSRAQQPGGATCNSYQSL